jgi:hypothetical protein
MNGCFKIFGPFEISNKQSVSDRERQKVFWCDCVDSTDDTCFELSFAKGIYLFSLRNGSNFNPQYVGMTERDFRSEVFSNKNLVMILSKLLEEKGVLCLHLLAKPKVAQRGFSKNINGKELFWIEDFIQQMCRIKNPDLLNVGKSSFLLRTAIAGITDGNPGRSSEVKSFRNAIGLDQF